MGYSRGVGVWTGPLLPDVRFARNVTSELEEVNAESKQMASSLIQGCVDFAREVSSSTEMSWKHIPDVSILVLFLGLLLRKM